MSIEKLLPQVDFSNTTGIAKIASDMQPSGASKASKDQFSLQAEESHVKIKDETQTESQPLESNVAIDDTVHYLSPVSLTRTSIQGEDRLRSICSADFYRYLNEQQYIHGEYSGSFSYAFSHASSMTYETHLERTLAIIKPDAVYFKDVVIRKIIREGFKILRMRKLHLSPEQASELYAQYYGQACFPYLVVSMSAAPVIVMILTCTNAVAKWKELIKSTGTLQSKWFFPKSMRYRFGIICSLDNVLHASEDLSTANREIRYFFPNTIIEPLLKDLDEVTDFLQLYVNPTLVDALAELCKKKPIEPIIFFAEWLLLHNPYQPKMNPEIIRLPT